MAARHNPARHAVDRWRRTWPEIVDELREARLASGLTQAAVAKAVGVRRERVSRLERLRHQDVSLEQLVRHAAAVGLRASVKLYPNGGALRDEAQARYIARLIERIGRAWRVTLEASMPIAGDLRAIDVLLYNGVTRIAVEVITRLRDSQSQLRAAEQKRRDFGADRLILVIAATHANRRALAEARAAIAGAYELDTQLVMSRLVAGQDPGRDAIVLLA